MAITLTIKGNIRQVREALTARGLSWIGDFIQSGKFSETQVKVHQDQIEKCRDWFNQSGPEDVTDGIGYPVGTLLFWSDTEGKEKVDCQGKMVV